MTQKFRFALLAVLCLTSLDSPSLTAAERPRLAVLHLLGIDHERLTYKFQGRAS